MSLLCPRRVENPDYRCQNGARSRRLPACSKPPRYEVDQGRRTLGIWQSCGWSTQGGQQSETQRREKNECVMSVPRKFAVAQAPAARCSHHGPAPYPEETSPVWTGPLLIRHSPSARVHISSSGWPRLVPSGIDNVGETLGPFQPSRAPKLHYQYQAAHIAVFPPGHQSTR